MASKILPAQPKSAPCAVAWDINTELSQEQRLTLPVTKNVVKLLEDGCSVPFIARYRKELTGSLPPQKLYEIREKFEELKKVQEQVVKTVARIEKAGPVAPQIRQSLSLCKTLHEVEMIEEPFKEASRGTLAARARSLQLEPLAMKLLHDPHSVQHFLDHVPQSARENLMSESDVQKSVGHILADMFAKDMKQQLEQEISTHSVTIECQQTTASKSFTDQKLKFQMQKYTKYFNFKTPIHRLAEHQILAINRAEKKKILQVKLVLPDAVKLHFTRSITQKYPQLLNSPHALFLDSVVKDAWNRLVAPQQARTCRAMLTRRAEEAALTVFRSNLRHLLMTAPLRGHTVLGIDPGFVHGCKLAVVDPQGNVLHTEVIHVHTNQHQHSAKDKLVRVITAFQIEVIAIGNGQGCRVVEELVSRVIKSNCLAPLRPRYAIVSECGASVYSASPLAETELPLLDVSLRGAVSIARRLQDPLAEMCKVDPKHVGVGMYQHDVSSKLLSRAAHDILEECISFVGIDLNYAPEHLLQYISGLSAARAKSILKFRASLPQQHFVSRQQLLLVPGIGEKTFQQCAGFVRIMPSAAVLCDGNDAMSSCTSYMSVEYPSVVGGTQSVPETSGKGGKRKRDAGGASSVPKKRKKGSPSEATYNPLDQTVIHPESYSLATQIIQDQGFTLQSVNTPELKAHFQAILQNPQREKILDRYTMNESDVCNVADIVAVLSRSGDHDIRQNYTEPMFREGIMSLEELRVNMRVTGVVSNVTTFGAFCDIGAGHDALIPIGEFSNVQWTKTVPPPAHHKGKAGNNSTTVAPAVLRLGDRIQATVKDLNVPDRRVTLRFVQVLTPVETSSFY